MADPRIKIYGLIACHIASDINITQLDVCLKSVLEQCSPLDLFCVSWSSTEPLRERAKETFLRYEALFARTDQTVVFLFQNGSHQQFQHYQLIFNFISSDPSLCNDETMVIFGDADDKWAPNRVRFMRECTLESPSSVVVFHWMFTPVGYGPNPDEYILEVASDNVADFEYWMTCIRYHVFARFFNKLADPRYLQSPFCDLAFDQFLRDQNPEYITLPPEDTVNGLYYYRGSMQRMMVQFTSKRLEVMLMRNYPNALPANPTLNSDPVDISHFY